MRVTYDPEKRERTLRERGLDFEDAAIVFALGMIVLAVLVGVFGGPART